MKRYETLGLEERHNDLPHGWKANPELARKRGLHEDYSRLKNEWIRDNPCASPEEITKASRKIADELGI